MQLIAVYTSAAGSSGGTTQGSIVVAGDGLFETAAADINGALVGGVPVAGHRGVLGQRQVGLGLLDLFRLVGVLVDNGL